MAAQVDEKYIRCRVSKPEKLTGAIVRSIPSHQDLYFSSIDMVSRITQITTKDEHDELVGQSKGIPTVIYVSNSVLPACKNFTPRYERLAEQWAPMGIQFCQLEFTEKTSMMFKFAPNQLPVTVFMVHDNWCKTVMGADLSAMEDVLGDLLEQAEK